MKKVCTGTRILEKVPCLVVLVIFLLLLTLLTNASAETNLEHGQAIKVQDIAGEWKGNWYENRYSGSMTLNIDPENSSAHLVFYDTPRGDISRLSKVTMTDGKVLLKSSRVDTTLTFREEKNWLYLEGEYEFKTGQKGTFSIKKKK